MGDLALTAVQIAPWFAIIFFGVVIANYTFFYWVGAGALVFFIWVLRPSFRIGGRELHRAEAPGFFAELDALHEKLGVAARMQVLLDDELNASATETRGLLGLLGTQRVLTLGVPLLASVGREELIAVIAHEYGHFSRRHGRLGHWLYRARVGWLKYADYVDESDSAFDKAAAWYAKRFVPYFSARSFVHSRQCEYEADADGALAVGPRVFGAALTRIAVTAEFWSHAFRHEVMKWQEESPTPPSNFHEKFSAAARKARLHSFLDKALSEQAGWSDTHPNLSARLAALHEQPHLAESATSAGAALLGVAWPKVLAEFDAKWSRAMQVDWALEHFRLKHITRELLDAHESAAGGWPPGKRLARAKAMRTLEPAKGLEELRRLHESNPSDQRIAFAYASALLHENDANGVPIMERTVKENPVYRMPAYPRLLAYFERSGDRQQIERYSVRRQLAARREGQALERFLTALENGKAVESSLPQNIKRVLGEALGLDPAVAKAWLLEGTIQLEIAANGSSVPMVAHALALAIDPKVLKEREEDEAAVVDRYLRALISLLQVDELTAVRTFFTTESIPVSITSRSAALLLTRA